MESIRSGPLLMDPDLGTVTLILDDGETEPCGFVADWDACPPGHERDWEWLLDRWTDSRRAADGYARAADFSYHDRLSPASWN